MPKTNVLAKIKKIDILNKVMGADWKQTITLTLGEIELTDANLIAIRKFRPDEEVMVNLSTMQLSLGDLELSQRQAMLDKDTDATPAPIPEPKPSDQSVDDHSVDLSTPLTEFDVLEGDAIEVKVFEDGEDDVDPANIVKSFQF